MKRATYLILTLITLACADDYYPPGLYGTQVERLLTGGDAKLWYVDRYVVDGATQPIADCQDSVWLYVAEQGTGTNDSLVAYEIRRGANCEMYDSIYYGSFYASGRTGEFRDSLIFEGGVLNFAMVEQLLSNDLSLSFRLDGADVFIESNGTDSVAAITADEIENFLVGSSAGNAERTFIRSRLAVNRVPQPVTSCEDSVRVVFRRAGDLIQAYELTPSEGCQDFDTIFYGNVSPSASSNNAFTDTLFFTDGQLGTVIFNLTSNSSFGMQYRTDTASIRTAFVLEE